MRFLKASALSSSGEWRPFLLVSCGARKCSMALYPVKFLVSRSE